jgi:hypothetical protein
MAITALMMMVLVLALVFQQSQGSWGAGIRQSGTETALRSVLGTFERDLSHAVDATAFGQSSSFASWPITFYTLDGVGTNRMPQKVEYSWSSPNVTRKTYTVSIVTSTNDWTFSSTPQSTAILNGSQPLSQCPTFTEAVPPTSAFSQDLPLFVKIEARATKGGAFSVVSGWSEGRNRPGHPEDKIVITP